MLEYYIELLRHTIANKVFHRHYERINKVAEFSRQMVTGEGQEELIVSYKARETDEQKKQRIKITNSLTRYATNQVRNYFRKVQRVDNVIKEIKHESEEAATQIDAALSNFFAGGSAWDYVLRNGEMKGFLDPNGLLIIERKDIRGALGEIIETQVYPFEVGSRDLINWSTVNGEIEWVIIKQHGVEVIQTGSGSSYYERLEDVTDYYLYAAGYVIKLKQFVNKRPTELAQNESEVTIATKDGKQLYFIQGIYENGTLELPVIPFGAYLDEKTDGKTRVSALDAAEEVFIDLINVKSEADLTRALHTFLQKIAYAPKCNFENDQGDYCSGGYLANSGDVCPSCSGAGVKVHLTTQDVILIALPDDKETFFPLQDFVHYVNLPDWLPKWQHDELLEKTIKRISLAIFNTEIFQAPQLAQTATAAVIEYDKIYDAIRPFANHLSKMWTKIATITAQYLELSDGFSARHSFPSDFKMKSETELINEYKIGREAGLSIDVLNSIENDLLSKKYVNSPKQVREIQALRKWKPFDGLSPETISFILSSRQPSDPDRILYENFSAISRDIVWEYDGNFHALPLPLQKQVVYQKVAELAATIQPVTQEQTGSLFFDDTQV